MLDEKFEQDEEKRLSATRMIIRPTESREWDLYCMHKAFRLASSVQFGESSSLLLRAPGSAISL